jgi:hypothetical protein
MALNLFDFNSVLWGVRMWIWWYLLLSIFLFSFVVIYFYKEKIKKIYYQTRYPEKLIKIIMHYKSGYFKEYWRIIPDKNEEFLIEGRVYKFSDKKILRDNDFYLRKKNNELYANIDGKKYNINDKNKLIYRWRSYPELHYFFNIPVPIDFDLSEKSLEFSSEQMQEFKDNDLFAKLLTMDTQKSMLVFIFVMGIINLLISALIFAKQMGWLDKVVK